VDEESAIAWLLQEGGPVIRYRTATELVDDATGIEVGRLAAGLVASKVVQQWLAQIQGPRDMGSYHGSNSSAFENACAKLCELGLRAGMLRGFDWRMEPYRDQLAEDPESVWNPITGGCLTWAGFHDEALLEWLRARLGVLYETAQAGSYDIYIDQDRYGDFPAAFRKRPLVAPRYYGRLVGIWDVYALAHWPMALASSEAQDQIDAVIAYILHPGYQALDEGYGVMRARRRRYYAIGWSVHLPGYGGTEFRRAMHAAMFVQRVELMAHFAVARQSPWFRQSLAHLESYCTDRGTYRFPSAYLREQTDGYYVTGAYMRLEADRRRRVALELDSTFRMLKIKRLIEEGK
jgi:hypothetical protein